MSRLTETDIKETFGIRVKLPVGLINYRAYEESVKGIEKAIRDEMFPANRNRLIKIRGQIKKVLKEL